MDAYNIKRVPLNTIKTGRLVKVVTVNGGDKFRQRMTDQGILPGAVIEIISGSKKGPFVIRVNNTRMIIGTGMTPKITVALL